MTFLRLATSRVGGCVTVGLVSGSHDIKAGSQVGGCVTVGLVSGSHDIPKAGYISGGWVCHCGTSEWVT